MSDNLPDTQRTPAASAAQIAAALRQAREKLEQARERAREPIAVVGIGCRLPGAASPDAYWRMLEGGQVGIRRVPADRWDADALAADTPKQAGRIASDRGGFIDGADRFDAAFFGISS
ncbi:MAG: beta-ketoacyl synthase N-terminal-like domain-containing protein, partial [Planctomycetota bacterium]